MGDHISFVLRHSPFSSARIFDALRSCVGLTMGDNPLKMIFIEDGVYAMSGKTKNVIEGFDWAKHLDMLQELEFDLIVDKKSADERGVNDVTHKAQLKSRDEIAAILKDGKAVITY